LSNYFIQVRNSDIRNAKKERRKRNIYGCSNSLYIFRRKTQAGVNGKTSGKKKGRKVLIKKSSLLAE